jgi:hypothetical protein
MSGLVNTHPLSFADTVPASQVAHRLALGVSFIDALSRQPVCAPLTCDLDSIGSRTYEQRCEVHSQGRQALRHAGRLAKLLARAMELAEDTTFKLRAYGRRNPGQNGYLSDNDPRQFVPRRLAFTPLLDHGIPPANRDNIRSAWLWPGASYPIPANATALRGRIRKGPDLDHTRDVPWTRVVVTRPAPAPAVANFATESQLAWGHGDDRGEFLILISANAVPWGMTPTSALTLRLWVFLPPVGVTFSTDDPLASLPLEDGGNIALNDVLRGTAIPSGYRQQAAIDLPPISPGSIQSIAEATLLYG